MISKDYICPFLFGVSRSKLSSPLNNHQCVEFLWDVSRTDEENKKSFKSLVNRLNRICESKGLGVDKADWEYAFNWVYDHDIEPALKDLSRKAEQCELKVEADKAQTQAQANAIIAQAHAQADAIIAKAQRHYSKALSDVRQSQALNSVPIPDDVGQSETSEDDENIIPDALEGIITGTYMPLSVSLGFLEHCINVLNAFPNTVDLQKPQKKDKDGTPLKDKRWEVVEQGRELLNVMRSGGNGNIKQHVESFQVLVKEKLSVSSANDDFTYENAVYGSPISIKTVREALDAVIANILLYLKQERKDSE